MTDDYADDIQNSPKLRLFALVRSDFGWKTRSFLATKKNIEFKNGRFTTKQIVENQTVGITKADTF